MVLIIRKRFLSGVCVCVCVFLCYVAVVLRKQDKMNATLSRYERHRSSLIFNTRVSGGAIEFGCLSVRPFVRAQRKISDRNQFFLIFYMKIGIYEVREVTG